IDNALANFEREELAPARERLERLWQPDGAEGEYDEELAEGSTEPAEGGDEAVPHLEPGPREGQREAVQARALLEKAERLLERVQPDDRPEVERLMERVRTALTDRQWD